LSVLQDLRRTFGGMVAEGDDNAGDGRKESMGVNPDISSYLHFAENNVQMIENVFLDDRQFLKKRRIDRAAEKEIHHHTEILVVLREVFDIKRRRLFQRAVRRVVDGFENIFKDLIRKLISRARANANWLD